MNNLTVIIISLLVTIILLLILNQKFDFTGKFKESKRIQKDYDKIHDKYKDLLD